MEKKEKYQKTIYACFAGYIVQAIVNNFVPLLFITFHVTYQIPLSQITLLVTFNFGIQLMIDLLSAGFVDRIGYRTSVVAAHILVAIGLILLMILPEICGNPFMGILIAVMIYGIGGGLLEVLISPIVEACPTKHKEATMSLLHSFYCWGHVGVVLLSTLFFTLFGIENWKILALIWALLPIINGIVLSKVPIASLLAEDEEGMKVSQLLSRKLFWLMMILMFCSGSCEQAVSQWASTFAESALGVSKTIGDLSGPMLFAALMGTSRAIYGKYGDKINLDQFMFASGILCLISYFMISLVPAPAIGLLGCGICGLSVGILWPGTFSMGAAGIRRGGTLMFALFALAGDLGCAGGPTFVGMVASRFGDDLKKGILVASIFPVLLLATLCFKFIYEKNKKNA